MNAGPRVFANDARLRALVAEAQFEPLTARCAFCPEWVFEGKTAVEARGAFLLHRLDEHGSREPHSEP